MILLLAGITLLLIAAFRVRRRFSGRRFFGRRRVHRTRVCDQSIFNLIHRLSLVFLRQSIGLSVLLIALAVFRFQFLKATPPRRPARSRRRSGMQARRSLAVFLLIFVMLAVGIATVGYLFLPKLCARVSRQAEGQISGIAALKVAALQDWRQERLADAELLYRNPAFKRWCSALSITRLTPRRRPNFRPGWIVTRSTGSMTGFSCSTRGVERLSAPPTPEPVPAYLTQETAAILSAGK